ncbi:DnaJ domain-containing protein [Stenotrophomonas sp. HITSZ_GD]|uniref:J domain-containing protein n=1 Tax=Stenotrophomonas sp. HITSZ_GD TaxID=3037248 RepID=UPI00240E4D1B|nr:DnaJ domain-containing protein [Stenotrophomonas sp. HITSZ_GD]MDG2526675.1 DnaJ domain-containing protein [Stenotrophomonas sp. HITSZ_GD]
MAEWLVVGVAFVIGYWLVAVFLPLLRGRGSDEAASAPPPVPEDAPAPRWFEVLEVDEQAGREEIVAAYKRRISQYHPDKVQHLGPERVALAEQQARRINAAYDTALRVRGGR